ncbi:MAG: hypothetical protein LBT00_06915 [Spirochaetaceae bacterium]|nr:hypothetical protein [Spirochaetaceae bacterium]
MPCGIATPIGNRFLNGTRPRPSLRASGTSTRYLDEKTEAPGTSTRYHIARQML